jgi:ribosomal protein S6E (S10)
MAEPIIIDDDGGGPGGPAGKKHTKAWKRSAAATPTNLFVYGGGEKRFAGLLDNKKRQDTAAVKVIKWEVYDAKPDLASGASFDSFVVTTRGGRSVEGQILASGQLRISTPQRALVDVAPRFNDPSSGTIDTITIDGRLIPEGNQLIVEFEPLARPGTKTKR